MFEIILVRHGETDWNRDRRIMGHKPIPLNANGRDQITRLSDYFEGVSFDAIYSSPVLRAKESAEILGAKLGVPVTETAALAEIEYGEWVGQTFDEVRAYPQFKDYHLKPAETRAPGGESMQEVFMRVAEFVENLRQEDSVRRIIAVSHADVIKMALVKYLAVPLNDMHRLRIDNGSHSHLWFQGKLERVLVVNALPRIDGFFEKTSLFAKEIKKSL